MTLLTKVRRINRILQQSAGKEVNFNDLSQVLSDVIDANLYILDYAGNVLGFTLMENYDCELLDKQLKSGTFPRAYNNRLISTDDVIINNQEEESCVFTSEYKCIAKNKLSTIIPIIGRGKRLGTLLMTRFEREFEENDVVLSEFGATVCAMEILRVHAEEKAADKRLEAVVDLAIDTLSYSEMEAIEHIFRELGGKEGLLVASKIADEVGITRSVIVNALRKLESAGVIESRSLGMKGTYIKVLNLKLLERVNIQ